MFILSINNKNFFTRYERFGYIATITLVGFFIFSPTIFNYFVQDDFWCIHICCFKSLRDLAKLFNSDLTDNLWRENQLRPLFALAYRLDYYFFGVNPVGYHLVNIILHVLNSVLIFFIVSVLTNGREWTAFIASTLFALAPAHTEPIAWITGGHTDAFPTFFYLSAFLFFALYRSSRLRGYLYLSIAAFVLGLFTKEILLTFPLTIVTYDLFFETSEGDKISSRLKKHITAYIPFFLLTLSYVCLRWIVFGNFVEEAGMKPLMVFLVRQIHNFRLLWLQFYDYPTIGRAPWEFQDRFSIFLQAITLIIFLIWLCFLLRNRSEYRRSILCISYFGVVWYLISILPLLVTYSSLTHLYHPSCGIYMAMAFLLFPFSPKAPTRVSYGRLAMTIFLIFAFGHTLVKANANWTKAGAVSRRVRADIERLSKDIPEGSPIIIDAPLEYRGAFLWNWVMPFALQKPFCSEDIYSKFQIIEPPDMYCGPDELWWSKMQQIIASLLSEQVDDTFDIYQLQCGDVDSPVTFTKGKVNKEELRNRIEELLKRPLEEMETLDTIDHELMYELIDAVQSN